VVFAPLTLPVQDVYLVTSYTMDSVKLVTKYILIVTLVSIMFLVLYAIEATLSMEEDNVSDAPFSLITATVALILSAAKNVMTPMRLTKTTNADASLHSTMLVISAWPT
jgi:hypothetical protein